MDMVLKVSHSGLRDWLIQRISAVVIGLYLIFIAAYLLSNQPWYFAQWHGLFSRVLVKVATLVTLVAILWHAWIGLWTVLTDYVKHTSLRLILQSILVILLLGFALWGVEILV
jgi:succinate dehydrogenase / fumarate reductase, membrane anchor subunit